jgi:uncharacterized protein YeaO (DUF488 family)
MSAASKGSERSSDGAGKKRADVVVKRIYEKAADRDGSRVLVDRVWPRGIKKADAGLTEWLKEVAPTSELRTWYSHDPEKYEEFARRYRQELADGPQREAFEELVELARGKRLTLLTATKSPEISQAEVLRGLVADAAS